MNRDHYDIIVQRLESGIRDIEVVSREAQRMRFPRLQPGQSCRLGEEEHRTLMRHAALLGWRVGMRSRDGELTLFQTTLSRD